jgi:TonB-linked SusC/RagA family outer membrane protein
MRRPVFLFFSLLTALGAEYCPGHAQGLAAKSLLPATLAMNPASPAVEWTVKGTVRDEKGEGLPGINVVLKGTTTGTTTDPQGAYTLTVPDGNGTLVFSYIGYVTEEVPINNRTTIDLSLVPDVQSLSEVVVTAFGVKQEKRALTYAVQEINSDLITQTNQPNALNALRGRVAGVNITSSSGAPGAGSSIVIRGINSLNPGANNQPLFVVDGIPISNETNLAGGREGANFTSSNRFADINPNDIESISVLKGPAASALYGLRAANGAVIITTKSGKAGKAVFNFNTSYSFDDIAKRPPMQSRYSRGANGAFNPASDIVDGPPIPEGEPVYNQWDELFRTGHQFQNSFSAAGGTDKVTYYSSVSRVDQTGVLPNSEFDRTTLKVNTSLRASDKVRFDGAATYINSNGTNPRMGVGGAGAISYGMRFSPEVPMQPYLTDLGLPNRYSNNIENPYYFAENAFQTERVNRVISSLGVNVQPVKWLEVDYRVGIDQYTDRRQRVASPRTLIGAGGNGSIEEQSFQNREINSNLLATARTTLAPDLNASLSLGNQLTFINAENLLGTGTNFVTPDFFSINNLTNYRVTLFPTRRNIFGVFADAKLDWRQTLYLSLTGRNDWASTLPENNRSFFYPSVSLGYVFTETLGLGSSSIFNYGKLRMSYAEVGKDASPYQIGNYYETLAPFGSVVGVRRNITVGDEGLRPERTKGVEFGTDLHFLNGRLRLDATYAIQYSVDQIVPVPVSRGTGFTTYVTNGGVIRNKSVELILDAQVFKRGDFQWNAIVNWSRIRGKVTEMPENLNVINFLAESAPWVKQRIQAGGRPGDWYGWQLSRVEDPESEYNGRLVIVNGYPDVNRNYQGRPLAQDDYIGNAFPDWEGGINNALSYKGLSLSFLFNFRQGGYVFDINRRIRYGNSGGETPTGTETDLRNRLVIFDGVRNTGTADNPVWEENDVPVRIGVPELYSQAFRYRLAKEFNGFQEASWIRLQNVSLSYALPQSLIGRTPFERVAVSVTGNNLWLTTPFVGFDPEQSAYGAGSNVFGYVGTNVPSTRSVYFGLNLTF